MSAPPDPDAAREPPKPPPEVVEDDVGFAAAKSRDAALALPLIGLALFTPPLVGLFATDASLFGAPVIVLYLFAAWAVLIFAAWRLSRRLAALPETET